MLRFIRVGLWLVLLTGCATHSQSYIRPQTGDRETCATYWPFSVLRCHEWAGCASVSAEQRFQFCEEEVMKRGFVPVIAPEQR